MESKNKILFQNDIDRIKIEEVDRRFHGNITIHFAHGVPKKVDIHTTKDIITLS